MTVKLGPGKRLVKALEKALPDGWRFSDADRLVLSSMESAEDRRTALTILFEAETARPSPSAHKATAMAGEIRQIELQLSKWQASLFAETDDPAPKSWQHQKAAYSRWNRA
jgi:hypothetical protein